MSRRGSILGGGRRPDVEEKWTYNLKQCVSQGQLKSAPRFQCVDANKGDILSKTVSCSLANLLLRVTDLARFQLLLYPGPI